MIEKPKLFVSSKEFVIFFLLLSFLFSFRLFMIYEEYKLFIEKPFYFTKVNVLQAYEKLGKKNQKYIVLKVHNSEFNLDFFTTTKYLKNLDVQELRLKIFPSKKMRFVDYLGTSFISSQINRVFDNRSTRKDEILEFIEKEHQNRMISDFYQAIFFAEPLDKSLREKVSILGISHLIALSGFHLAILSAMLFFLIQPLYRYVQQRYFPYRFSLIDVGFMVLILLAWYVWFVGSPASLLRSYAMMLMGWFLLILGIELISFAFLTSIVLLLLVLFPKMLLSLAFWFSVTGVFYIFLLLQYFSHLNKYLIMIMISFAIFVLMLPIVHFIFPLVSSSQLFSPFLSLLFSLFYPLSMALHLCFFGDFFDTSLIEILNYKSEIFSLTTDKLFLFFYLSLSLFSVYYKRAFFILLALSLGFATWMFSGFLV